MVQKLDPQHVRFEWPAGIKGTSWGAEVWARYVDVVVDGGSKVVPGRMINVELKFWTLRTLQMKTRSGGLSYQLVKDTAFFDPKNIRWVFDARKLLTKEERAAGNAIGVAKSKVMDAFVATIKKDSYLTAKWSGADDQGKALPFDEARVRSLLDKVLDVVDQPPTPPPPAIL